MRRRSILTRQVGMDRRVYPCDGAHTIEGNSMDREGRRVELELTRETLRFERFVTRGEDQVTIEGEATLPGSMRDAVTVLSVQAQAHIIGAQTGMGEAGVRGRVCFQVLYTQGDLTRIRSLETRCTFDHTWPLAGAAPGMRICAAAYVEETAGRAASGRITLRARLAVEAEVFEAAEKELVTAVNGGTEGLQTRMQTIRICSGETPGAGKTLVREEFELPERLGAGDVLCTTATVGTCEISGGSGHVGVSGVIEVRVLHRPKESGEALVETVHEMPYEMSIDAAVPEGGQLTAAAEVTDVMADSTESDKGRMLRVEAEISAALRLCRQTERELLADMYSTEGPVLQPSFERMDIHTAEECAEARESTRVQVSLPPDAPPIGRVLAAFARPILAKATPGGRRLDTEGVMDVTLIYLPVDSDIPYAVQTKEPFFMAFPVEAGENASVHAYAIETNVGPSTSDRAELRCVLGVRAVSHGTASIRAVSDVAQLPEEKREYGFVLVWPEEGESRWETARRLRVPESSLRPAGKRALLAFRK